MFTLVQAEAVVWRCSAEKMFLEISQNPQENTCARVSFLIKLIAITDISVYIFTRISKFLEMLLECSFYVLYYFPLEGIGHRL